MIRQLTALFLVLVIASACGTGEPPSAGPTASPDDAAAPPAATAPSPGDAAPTAGSAASPADGSAGTGEARPADGPPSLCDAPEKILFTCTIAGKDKMVSLCGNSTFTRSNGTLQYRFGKRGALELVWPEELEGSLARFSLPDGEGQPANGHWYALSFVNDGVMYEITDSLAYGWDAEGNPEAQSEMRLTVTKASKTLATLTCAEEGAASLESLAP